jgi:UDP-glucose 6-dehydrogenase
MRFDAPLTPRRLTLYLFSLVGFSSLLIFGIVNLVAGNVVGGKGELVFAAVVFMNIMYDLAQAIGADFDAVAQAMSADERIGKSHMHPVHASGHSEAAIGRGAGGHCFIKDFAAFEKIYKEKVRDTAGQAALAALQEKNNELLRSTNKDLDLLEGVFGKDS